MPDTRLAARFYHDRQGRKQVSW